MKSKKNLQKILCIALAVASVFSMLTPSSYAAELRWFKYAGGLWGAEAALTDVEQREIEEVIEEIKYKNEIAVGDPHYKAVAVAITRKDGSNGSKLIFGVVPQALSDYKAVQTVCHNEITKNKQEGYGLYKILPNETKEQQAQPTYSNHIVLRLEFDKSSNPILVNDETQIENGLLGVKRDVFLRLLGQEPDPQKARTMAGLTETTYGWIKQRMGRIFSHRRALITDFDALMGAYEKGRAAYFGLSFAEQKDPANAALIASMLKTIMDRVVLLLEIMFLNPSLGAVAGQNKAAIAAWKMGETTLQTLVELLHKLHKQSGNCISEARASELWSQLLAPENDEEGKEPLSLGNDDNVLPLVMRELFNKSSAILLELLPIEGHRKRLEICETLPQRPVHFFVSRRSPSAIDEKPFVDNPQTFRVPVQDDLPLIQGLSLIIYGVPLHDDTGYAMASPYLKAAGFSETYWLLRWHATGIWSVCFFPKSEGCTYIREKLSKCFGNRWLWEDLTTCWLMPVDVCIADNCWRLRLTPQRWYPPSPYSVFGAR
ncbi:hypothetical protein FACS189481_3250 [Clostridia bacterium]|nr:hypothetical protein FACS189481_3250 [Clostridia bacterium]